MMEGITNTIKQEASGADELVRRKLLDGLRDLSYSIETPNDTLHRIVTLVDNELFLIMALQEETDAASIYNL